MVLYAEMWTTDWKWSINSIQYFEILILINVTSILEYWIILNKWATIIWNFSNWGLLSSSGSFCHDAHVMPQSEMLHCRIYHPSISSIHHTCKHTLSSFLSQSTLINVMTMIIEFVCVCFFFFSVTPKLTYMYLSTAMQSQQQANCAEHT